MANLLKALLPIVIMSLCGLLIGWRINGSLVDAVAGYGLLLVAFAFAMIWVGVLLGSVVATPEGVNGLAFVVLFPLTFMASTFVPADTMPGPLQTVAEWNPVTTLADALRILFGNPNTPPLPGDPWPIAPPDRVHDHLHRGHRGGLRATGRPRLPPLDQLLRPGPAGPARSRPGPSGPATPMSAVNAGHTSGSWPGMTR